MAKSISLKLLVLKGEWGSKYGFPKIRGTLFGGPYKKDSSIWGAILSSPYFGKLLNMGIQIGYMWDFP